jgi:hypothetical protein
MALKNPYQRLDESAEVVTVLASLGLVSRAVLDRDGVAVRVVLQLDVAALTRVSLKEKSFCCGPQFLYLLTSVYTAYLCM